MLLPRLRLPRASAELLVALTIGTRCSGCIFSWDFSSSRGLGDGCREGDGEESERNGASLDTTRLQEH